MLLPAENTEDAEETEAGVPFWRIHPSLFSDVVLRKPKPQNGQLFVDAISNRLLRF